MVSPHLDKHTHNCHGEVDASYSIKNVECVIVELRNCQCIQREGCACHRISTAIANSRS
jgi:hypothetical protein